MLTLVRSLKDALSPSTGSPEVLSRMPELEVNVYFMFLIVGVLELHERRKNPRQHPMLKIFEIFSIIIKTAPTGALLLTTPHIHGLQPLVVNGHSPQGPSDISAVVPRH